MCLNPGHAYMRAAIRAVPAAEFAHWKAERSACAGEALQQSFHVKLGAGNRLETADGAPLGAQTVLAGTCLKFDLAPNPAPVTFTASGGHTKTIPANTRADSFFGFKVPTTGNFTVYANDGPTVTFTAITATRVEVDLADFRLNPVEVKLEAGKSYLIEATNVHSVVHNLFIGHWDGKGAQSVLAKSPDAVAAGTVGPFVANLPAGTYDMWCNVPGHYGLGMVGKVVVA
jgi:uncharacterized cupredoxin-like copper-binding protein